MGTDHVGMRRNREGQLVTLASGFPEPSPLSLPTPCYLASPISFRCFCQTQASVSPASASLPPLVLSQRAGREGKELGYHTLLPRAPPPIALLLGNAPRPTRSYSPHRCPLSVQDTWEPGDPRTSPRCSDLRRETESRLTPICFCDLFCRETRRPAIARERRQTQVPCELSA